MKISIDVLAVAVILYKLYGNSMVDLNKAINDIRKLLYAEDEAVAM